MKFGYVLPNYGDKISAGELVELASVCEEVGFDSVWATDHIIMPTELRDPYGQLIEPLTLLSFISARCQRIRVGTSCLVLPQRNPILVAKQAAALDVLSGGRLVLGLGAGWAEREFGFLGADFAGRGKVMDEGIELMRKLWKEEVVNFEGARFHLKDALFLPKPVKGDIPVWIGGNGPASLRRAARLGDGWHPVGPALDDFASGVSRLRESGRELTISMRMTTDVRKKKETYVGANGEKRVAVSGSPAEIRKGIDEYAEAGLEYYCASMNHPHAEEIGKDLRRFSADVVRSYA